MKAIIVAGFVVLATVATAATVTSRVVSGAIEMNAASSRA
jgi:hypothetical protein